MSFQRFNSSNIPMSDEEDLIMRNKELEEMKLPGSLDKWTGTVMYPDEDTKLWDNRKLSCGSLRCTEDTCTAVAQ